MFRESGGTYNVFGDGGFKHQARGAVGTERGTQSKGVSGNLNELKEAEKEAAQPAASSFKDRMKQYQDKANGSLAIAEKTPVTPPTGILKNEAASLKEDDCDTIHMEEDEETKSQDGADFLNLETQLARKEGQSKAQEVYRSEIEMLQSANASLIVEKQALQERVEHLESRIAQIRQLVQ